ncbi:site-specific integrase [Moraxella nasovis]|uniref:tyrosine-type recombinase/integrase n=1 Tax=Moraxella nasovis TaxID=2904121 RepID=UPI001F607A12|nr:site-specific integrase [Moraxella nasovis]UNU73306.1 site-specific integrase [Moraxella nasovis]
MIDEVKQKSPSIANRILIYARMVMKWCVTHGYITTNPLKELTAYADFGIVKPQKSRVLNDEELIWLFKALQDGALFKRNCLAIQFLLLYGCRNGELRLARKADFDFIQMVWTVPQSNHKMGYRTHTPIFRPILDESLAVIDELIALSGNELLLCNRQIKKISANEPIARTWANLIPLRIRQHLNQQYHYVMKPWCIHDLRRTARTRFSSFTSLTVAEMMLGHQVTGIRSVYDHYHYLPEQTNAYRLWFNYLNSLKQQATKL